MTIFSGFTIASTYRSNKNVNEANLKFHLIELSVCEFVAGLLPVRQIFFGGGGGI